MQTLRTDHRQTRVAAVHLHQTKRPTYVEVIDGKNLPVNKPAVADDSKGIVVDLPAEIIKTGYRREGAPERSFIYSLGVHLPDRHERRGTQLLLLGRRQLPQNTAVITCKAGDRSNVIKHHM